MKHIKVDSYGKCLNNREMPRKMVGRDRHDDEDFLRLVAKYKFHLSFENAICNDYVTEKLFGGGFTTF